MYVGPYSFEQLADLERTEVLEKCYGPNKTVFLDPTTFAEAVQAIVYAEGVPTVDGVLPALPAGSVDNQLAAFWHARVAGMQCHRQEATGLASRARLSTRAKPSAMDLTAETDRARTLSPRHRCDATVTWPFTGTRHER